MQPYIKYLPIQDMVQSPSNNLLQDLCLLLLHSPYECLLCRKQIILAWITLNINITINITIN